jgi:hypothetical protein
VTTTTDTDPVIANEALVLDLLEWVSSRPRTHAETMDAWRTSCPRLTIWEDAVDLGLVACVHRAGCKTMVSVTPAGRALLKRAGRRSA